MRQDLDAGRRQVAAGCDLVFDFAGIRSPDLENLCLMLTARNLANEEHRKVWLHALPEDTWRMLHAMGLGHFFELLPQIGGTVN